jgi:hypothetical protein
MTTVPTRASGTTRVHPESASQTTSLRLWIVLHEAGRQQRRRSSKSSYRRNAHGIQVPIMRQLIATTSGGHSAIPVVARRTSQRTKDPKRMTKGTNRTARSSRMPQKPSMSSSGELRLQFQAGTETAAPRDHVCRAGGTTTTPLVGGPHLVLTRRSVDKLLRARQVPPGSGLGGGRSQAYQSTQRKWSQPHLRQHFEKDGLGLNRHARSKQVSFL